MPVRAVYPFYTKQQLADDIKECLTAIPSGQGCCAAGHCTNAGAVEMPDWDVSRISNFAGLFWAGESNAWVQGLNGGVAFDQFNVDISAWDLSSATDTVFMFKNCAAFNQPIGSWNVSSLRIAYTMFQGCTSFNQPLADWDVSSVTSMNHMFAHATSFNQPLSDWDVSSVDNMEAMFYGATGFLQDITGWSTKPGLASTSMFQGATAWLASYNPPSSGFNSGPPGVWELFRYQTKQQLVDDVKECLTAVPSGQGCCAAGHCSHVGYVEMPDWDVSLITDMSGLFWAGDASSPTHGVNGGVAFDQFDVDISGWNVASVTTMANMFKGAASFDQSLAGWDVSSVTDMQSMFSGAVAFNQPIGSWVVSSVTDMQSMFSGAVAFNQPIGSWDVSFVTDTSRMFVRATAFNHPIGSWNVSSVTSATDMFFSATSFNHPIGSWDVSSVTDMAGMFDGATAFNQPLSPWIVSSVTDMSAMFWDAAAFNQPIGEWDVSSVTDMSSMFRNAAVFDQPLGTWDVSSVVDMSSMFRGAAAFKRDIRDWDTSSLTSSTDMFNGATAWLANNNPPTSRSVDGPPSAWTLKSCDASAVPTNGASAGNCTSSLIIGKTCVPTCVRGYAPSGPTTCAESARLVSATCQLAPVIFEADYDDQSGAPTRSRPAVVVVVGAVAAVLGVTVPVRAGDAFHARASVE